MDEKEKFFIFGMRGLIKDRFLKTRGKDEILKAKLEMIDVIISSFNIIEDVEISEVKKVIDKIRGEI